MNIFTILLLMIFLHIVDDYYLQGILAKMKQKSWWEENAPDKKYKCDYIVALICHAFSWTFLILLPWLFIHKFNPPWLYYILFILNWGVHAIVDDLKANKRKINLIIDQTLHLAQILVTWALLSFVPL